MPEPYPGESREDVVRVARNREPGVPLQQIAADVGISESCLTNWPEALRDRRFALYGWGQQIPFGHVQQVLLVDAAHTGAANGLHGGHPEPGELAKGLSQALQATRWSSSLCT